MKKFLTSVLVLIMIACVSISAFADMGGFTESPSKKKAPELVSGSNSSADCTAELIITAYADRNDLSTEHIQAIERAYTLIRGTQNLGTLHHDIALMAYANGVESDALTVSDLFNMHATNCNHHDGHGHFDVVLAPETLENFVCLVYFDGESWHVVESAEVTNNGEHLEFDAEQLGAYAIIVSKEATNPIRDEEGGPNVGVIVGVSVASLAVLIVIAALLLKKFAPETYKKIVSIVNKK